jgi:hypothetical protein
MSDFSLRRSLVPATVGVLLLVAVSGATAEETKATPPKLTMTAGDADAGDPSPRIKMVATELPLTVLELRCVIACTDGLQLTTRWVAENCEGTPRNYTIGTATFVTKPPLNVFSFTRPTKGWPEGMYRLDLIHKGRTIHVQRYLLGGWK